jgi:PAS domain S-box-containing protein
MRSIRTRLRLVVVAVVVPGWLGIATIIYSFYQYERVHIAQGTIATARAFVAAVDAELQNTITLTQFLAASPLLAAGDFAAFYREATTFLPLVSGSNIVLTDASGQQIVNTLRPYGEPLPHHGNPASQRKVIETGKPVISDVFIGPVFKQPVVAIEVPVSSGNEVKYTLAVGLFPEHLIELLRRQRLPRTWIATVLDTAGVSAARTRSPELFVGRKAAPSLLTALAHGSEGMIETLSVEGIPVFSAFSRSAVSGWTVAIGIPAADLSGSLNTILLLGSVAAIVLLLIGIALAGRQSAQIARAVQNLIPPALALGRGETPDIPQLQVREADEVAQALARTAVLLEQLHLENLERQRREEIFRLIVESAPNAMIMTNNEGRIVLVNAGTEKLFGYVRDELLRQPIEMLVPDRFPKTGPTFSADVIADSAASPTGADRYLHGRRKNGSEFPIEISLSPIENEDGLSIVSAIVDITARKQAEEKTALLATIVESSDDAIIAKTLDGNVASWNAGAERLFGYSAAEMIGRPVSLLIPDSLHDEEGYIVGQLLQGKVISHYETVRTHKSGRLMDISLTVSPIRDPSGKVIGASKIARDITEHKLVEEKKRKFNEILEEQVAARTAELAAVNQDLEEFAYAASHDLKAPLRVIDNASKWLEEDLKEHLTAETRDNMNLLRGRIKRMEKLLDDLLEYSRIGRTADERFAETISGNALMVNILALLSPPEGFTITIGPGFNGIRVRRMPLQQILMNLISNAIKHHDRKQGRIDVAVEDRGAYYLFSVRDDGPGIAAEYQDQIFKMFMTLKPRDQIEGSGMGLAMVRKNIEVFGGKLTLESAVGKGSAFRFTWPKHQKIREKSREYLGAA